MTSEIQVSHQTKRYISANYGKQPLSGIRPKTDIQSILKRDSIAKIAQQIKNNSINYSLKKLAANLDKLNSDDQTFVISCYRSEEGLSPQQKERLEALVEQIY